LFFGEKKTSDDALDRNIERKLNKVTYLISFVLLQIKEKNEPKLKDDKGTLFSHF